MNMEERLQAVVSQAETDGSLWHTIIHGNNATSVSTENGKVPSVAKQLKDVRDELINGAADYLGSCLQAKTETTAVRDNALVIKSQIEDMGYFMSYYSLKEDMAYYFSNNKISFRIMAVLHSNDKNVSPEIINFRITGK